MDSDKERLAKILALFVAKVLDKGIRHYNRAGEYLDTEEKIIETLVSEGEVFHTSRRN